MRLFFITPRPLGDPRSGGTIKSAALLAYLDRRHEVDVACFVPPDRSKEAWGRAGRTVTVPLRKPRSGGRLLASYGRRIPLSVERNRSPSMATAIEELAAERNHDVIFVDGWLMGQYLPSGFDGVSMLHQHNAEHVMWRRQAELERSPLRRAVLELEARRVRRYEAAMLAKFDVVFAVSELDRAAMSKLTDGSEIRLLPNLPDPSLLERPALEPPDKPVVLFLGTLSWQPNIEGLTRFLRDAFPALRRVNGDVRLIVAGAGASGSLATLAARTPGVEFVGEVLDAEPLYRMARAFVDPGLGGAGTHVKLLNALARGLPIVATTDAAGGLGVVSGEHALLANDPATTVAPLEHVLTDDALWRNLSRSGRELIRSRFVPEIAFASLDEALGEP